MIDDPELLERAEARECPACGRQARKGWTNCPWCGIALGAEVWAVKVHEGGADRSGAVTNDEGINRPRAVTGYEGIDDPELLARAEEEVRRLRDARYRREAGQLGRGADDLGDGTDEPEEPAPVGWECPACGRQAQEGWTRCPWCGLSYPARHPAASSDASEQGEHLG